MTSSVLNVIIVADQALIVNGLKNNLQKRFGPALNVVCVYDFKSLLKKVDRETDIVIVDPVMEGKKGTDVLRSVKLINPHVSGIFHTSCEDVTDILFRLLNSVPKASGHVSYDFAFN
jgi:DNA-binding NarL/FixJ family response regulator